MAAKVLNIEISDLTISVCCAAPRGKGVRIFQTFVFPTPEGCVADGVVTDIDLLARTLKNQLGQNGLGKVKSVIFAISSTRIAVREVKLPPMKKKLLASAITTNAAQYFPIELGGYRVSHHILEAPGSLRPFYRVLALATPLAILTAYTKLADRAGLSLRSIDLTGNSQYRLFKSLNSEGVTLYADIGSSGSSISFIRDGVLLLQRSFSNGPDELIANYMMRTGRSHKDYIQLMRELDSSAPDFSPDSLPPLEEIQADLSRLSGNITRAIDYFGSTQLGVGVSRIVLTGLNRHIVGLRDLIFEATGLETLYLDDLQDFSRLVGNSAEAAGFTGCLGSCLGSLDLSPQLSRGERRKQIWENVSLLPGVLACLFIVAAAGGFTTKAYLDYRGTEGRLNALRQEIDTLHPVMDVYSRYLSYQSSEAELALLNLQLQNPNYRLVELLNELEQKAPAELHLVSASFSTEGLVLSVTVSSYPEAASLVSALRGFEGIQRVEISELSKTEAEGRARITFAISAFYGPNPYLNGTNPYAGELYADIEEAEPQPDASEAQW